MNNRERFLLTGVKNLYCENPKFFLPLQIVELNIACLTVNNHYTVCSNLRINYYQILWLPGRHKFV